MNNLTLDQQYYIFLTAVFLLGLVFGAAVSSTVHAYQESRRRNIDRFRDNWE